MTTATDMEDEEGNLLVLIRVEDVLLFKRTETKYIHSRANPFLIY